MRQRHACVVEQRSQHIDHGDRGKGVGGDRARKVWVREAVAQREACRRSRDYGHLGRFSNLSSRPRRTRAARSDDGADTLAVERVACKAQLRAGQQVVGDVVGLVVELAQRLQHAESHQRHAWWRFLWRPTVVRRRVRQRRAGLEPPLRPAARAITAAAWRPHTDIHQPLGAVHIVEQHV
eukprot:5902681-Prymnesium_polylepis.1